MDLGEISVTHSKIKEQFLIRVQHHVGYTSGICSGLKLAPGALEGQPLQVGATDKMETAYHLFTLTLNSGVCKLIVLISISESSFHYEHVTRDTIFPL